jgi:hypothetical protein
LSRFGRGIAAGSPIFGEDTDTTKGEALAAGRNNGWRNLLGPYVGNGLHVRDFDIPAASDFGFHCPSVIVDGCVVGQSRRHGGPVAGGEVPPVALVRLACRGFQ